MVQSQYFTSPCHLLSDKTSFTRIMSVFVSDGFRIKEISSRIMFRGSCTQRVYLSHSLPF